MLASGPDGEFDALLADLVVDNVRYGWKRIEPVHVATLTAHEADAVARSIPHRQAEFATGRCLLRELLDDDIEIPVGPSGAPVLPNGTVASLAHDNEMAVALVASSDQMHAVGIDIEPITTLEPDVASIVVRPDDIVPTALAAFVAKEAAYKAWSVLGGEMLDHHDVRVTVEAQRFVADLRSEMVLHGRIGERAGRIVACAFSPAR